MNWETTIDREEVYRKLWEYTDKHGYLTLSQRALADATGYHFVRINYLFKEFVQTGRMKQSRTKFLMYDPDGLDWGPEYDKERQEKLAGKGRFS